MVTWTWARNDKCINYSLKEYPIVSYLVAHKLLS